jgi:hypothetical protein
MNNFPYPKGSVWRRWDLQCQTILDDGYVSLDKYYEEIKTNNPTGWAKYVAKVGGEANALRYDSKAYFTDTSLPKNERCIDYVRNLVAFVEEFYPELECIGLTDHNYFDDSLLDCFLEYSKKSRLKVLPGIEINCQGIHMLVFFPGTLYERETFSAGIQAFLIKFGINNRTNSDGVLTTTSADIKEILDEVKKNGGIVIFPHCNSSNGLFQERTSTDRTHLADIFNHQKINLLQARHQRSCLDVSDYINGKSTLRSKFCTHISSDARALRDLGLSDKDGNYLWIKADPTFEGLKQIIYEPEQRIFVGPHKPEEKKSYFVIDRVRFLDNTGEANFGSDVIEVNQHLTTIIGGKSTGKSLLLYYMAKTIDKKEVETRTTEPRIPVTYEFDKSVDFNFEVIWKDGQRSLLKTPAGSSRDDSKERKILYVPQKYLNTLSEANIKSREALNEFVLSIILQDQETNERYQKTVGTIRSVARSIAAEIGELFSEQEDITQIEEDLKQVGDEKGIKEYIHELQVEADEIKAKSGLGEQELQTYDDLVSREKAINSQVSNLLEDKKTITTLTDALTSQIQEMLNTSAEYQAYLNDEDVKARSKVELGVLDSFQIVLDTATSRLTLAIEEKLSSSAQQLATITADVAPLVQKVRLQSDLKQKTEAISNEEKKLNEIAIKNNALRTKREAYEKKISAIVDAYQQMFATYENLRNEFTTFESKFGEITLGVHVGFNEEAFNSRVVKEYLNKTDLKRVVPDAQWGEEFVYAYDPGKHFTNITAMFNALLNGTLNTLKGRHAKDAVIHLFDDHFYLDFRIFYKSDSLDKMSPGKKGLVLLQLLINLSNEEWPILLDQPEDDLDNRSVYEDLVAFLKTKKLQRQIIIVTHNPNLVVGADAEETVVANQSGQELGRDNRKHKFEYVSGALENTFELTATEEPAVLYRKGIRQHVYEILEGGKEAFQKREQKYDFPPI